MLTHHRVMDAAPEDFMAALAALVASHRAARWVGVAQLLAPA